MNAVPTLGSILAAIRVAETMEHLEQIRPHAAQLEVQAKERAIVAYRKKKSELERK